MRVLIVGGGIAGLCLAHALGEMPIEVDLVEVKSAWTVYGVGIIQQSNVIRAMSQLGILDEYFGASFPFDNVSTYDAQGKLIAKFPTPRLAGPEFPANLGISRLALHNVLVKVARSHGANIRTGCTVNAISQGSAIAHVTFSDGTARDYDLVVGCDGAHSKVRNLLFGDVKPRLTGQSVWRYNFRRPEEIDHLAAFYGPKGNAGLVPLASDLMYMFLTTSEPDNPRLPADQLHLLMQERLSDFGGIIAELRPKIADPAGVIYRPLEYYFAPEWYRGRVLLIGDAAHTTTPHLGHGAGMAIEDALVLKLELAKGKSMENVLSSFVSRRFERCKFIADLSVQVGDWEKEHTHQRERIAAINQGLECVSLPV